MNAAEVWKDALPQVRNKVTGVGIWAALNSCVAITIENGVFVLGLSPKDADLMGHLKMPQTKRLMEAEVKRTMGAPTEVRVIEGTSMPDWERAKRKDAEARRLQEIQDSRVRAEIAAKTNWEGVFEQLSRRYAAIPNKSLPQNRAKFFKESIEFVAEALKDQPVRDELNERNFGRCIERIAQYTEVPSTLVAALIFERVEGKGERGE